MKYRIITVPGTDPVEYKAEKWVTRVVGRWWKKRTVSGWERVQHVIFSPHSGDYWIDDQWSSIEDAEKDIAHWNRQEANTRSTVVKEVGEFKP